MNPESKMIAPDTSNIEEISEVVKGVDGNDINIYISKPKAAAGPTPGLLYFHGGGMAMQSATEGFYRYIRQALANRGFVVVMPDFRNATGKLGRHAYPAGLNDCMSALAWTNVNRAKLGMTKLIIAGESGGGNLTLASAIRARQEGRLHEFDGIFAMCPYIAGPEIWRDGKAETSLEENSGFFVDMGGFLMCARLYDPDRKHAKDPCAWPYHATVEDLKGLPPTVISSNELDPLRDEGLAIFKKLVEAGVQAESRVVKGLPHGGDILCQHIPACRHHFDTTLDKMWAFANSL